MTEEELNEAEVSQPTYMEEFQAATQNAWMEDK
jgi:hypothetical protein